MSSIVGHTLIGMAIGDNATAESRLKKFFILVFFAGLSISPDLDYLPTWLLGFTVEPRYSHSIAGGLLIGVLGLAIKKWLFPQVLGKVNPILIFLAPLSHIFLDYWVGVHRNPLFWPLADNLLTSPHGLLPSAGKLDLHNHYLWLNLTIELGILIPAAQLISSQARNRALKSKAILLVSLGSLLVFGYISYGLQR